MVQHTLWSSKHLYLGILKDEIPLFRKVKH